MKLKREKMKLRDAERLWFHIIDYVDSAAEMSAISSGSKEFEGLSSKEFSQKFEELEHTSDCSEKKLIEMFHGITGWKPTLNDNDEWEVRR